MISYNDLYEATRKERYSEQLQELPKNFISEVSEYLKEKKEMSSKQDNAFSDIIIKTKKQLENATTLFKELIRLRKKKILDLILIAAETGISKRDFDNMLDFEKELFENLMKSIDASDKKVNDILEGNEKKEENQNEMIKFIENVEEFLGPEGEKMGGFSKGQIANIPKQIAQILIDDGKAEKVEE